jgi:hypothetical protein
MAVSWEERRHVQPERFEPLLAELERRGFDPFEPVVDFILERAALPAAAR